MFDKSVTVKLFFIIIISFYGMVRYKVAGILRTQWPDEALVLLFVTTQSVYYSLFGSQSKLNTLLFFHVFVSVDFVSGSKYMKY